METVVKKLYEAMFLVDSAEAVSDWEGINKIIKNIMERAEAEIVSIRKWDERRLAYDINGKSRGTYILCYFRADGEKISDIERDVRLSDRIMRVLVLSAEHMSQADIEKDTPATQAEKHAKEVPANTLPKNKQDAPAESIEKIAEVKEENIADPINPVEEN